MPWFSYKLNLITTVSPVLTTLVESSEMSSPSDIVPPNPSEISSNTNRDASPKVGCEPPPLPPVNNPITAPEPARALTTKPGRTSPPPPPPEHAYPL